MFNVQQITSRLAGMSDSQLQQYAAMHKDDPYILPLAKSEFDRRQQIRASGQGQQPQQTVADEALQEMSPQMRQQMALMQAAQAQQAPQEALPEQQGIGPLPAQNIQGMADGGIAGYAEGGSLRFAKGNKVFNPDEYLQNDNVQRFLAYINAYEGSPKPNETFGHKKFDSFADHPRKLIPFGKKGDKTSAAGLYQFLAGTWDEQKKKLGLKDFSPANQQRAAIGLLKDKGALDAVVAGDFDKAKYKVRNIWASLPGNTSGKATGQVAHVKPHIESLLRKGASPQEIAQAGRPANAGIPALIATAAGIPTAQAATGRSEVPAKDSLSPGEETIAPPVTPRKPIDYSNAIYDDQGNIISGAPQEIQQSDSPLAAMLLGGADVFLGIPEFILKTVATDVELAKGTPAEKARKLAEKNKMVQLAGILRSGKFFGLENDPAYGKDPLSLLAAVPSMTVEQIVKATGTDNAVAQTILDNALVLAPVLKRAKQVEYNVPKLPGKEGTAKGSSAVAATEAQLAQAKAAEAAAAADLAKRTTPPKTNVPPEQVQPGLPGIPAATAAEQAKAAADAQARAQVEAAFAAEDAARGQKSGFGQPTEQLSLFEKSMLPESTIVGEFSPFNEQIRAAAKAQKARDSIPADVAEMSAAAAEARRGQSAVDFRKASERTKQLEAALENAKKPPSIFDELSRQDSAKKRALADAAVLGMGSAAASQDRPEPSYVPNAEGVPRTSAYEPWEENFVPSEAGRPVVQELPPTAKTAAAEEAAAATGKKKRSFDDEDLLTFGLQMMMAPAGQDGSGISKFLSNVGRSGIATLQAKTEREKEEREVLKQQAQEAYVKAMTKQLGQDPEAIRTMRAMRGDKGLYKMWQEQEWIKDLPTFRASIIKDYNAYLKAATEAGETKLVSFDQYIEPVKDLFYPNPPVNAVVTEMPQQ